jgi:hypothetical protein
MSKVTSPPEKKRLSLALDRRNIFRENDKSSRKSIANGKARAHRKERRIVDELLSHEHITAPDDDATAIEGAVKAKARSAKLSGFKKWPDRPLAEVISRKLAQRKRKRES